MPKEKRLKRSEVFHMYEEFRAAGHEIAVPLYEYFCNELSIALGKEVETGEFGADMKVELLNNGPVTICMDTKNKE